MHTRQSFRFLLIVTLFAFFASFGCGDEEDDGENPLDNPDAFDSGPRDMLELPVVSLATQLEETLTTAEDSYLLSGVAYRAGEVRVNGETVELGDEISEELFQWETEVQLSEGENTFEIKAVDDEGRESEPLEVTVTMDPEYVSAPPENLRFWSVSVFFFWDHQKNYDSWLTRPDEMECEITSTLTHYNALETVSYTRNLRFDTLSGHRTYISDLGWTHVDLWCPTETTYTASFEFDCWENDDGIFSNADDPVGTGAITLTLPCQEAASGTRTTRIDVNTAEIQYFITPE